MKVVFSKIEDATRYFSPGTVVTRRSPKHDAAKLAHQVLDTLLDAPGHRERLMLIVRQSGGYDEPYDPDLSTFMASGKVLRIGVETARARNAYSILLATAVGGLAGWLVGLGAAQGASLAALGTAAYKIWRNTQGTFIPQE